MTTTLIHDLKLSREQNVLNNVRRFLANETVFSDQLLSAIQQTLWLLNNRIGDLKGQIATIDGHIRQGVREKIEQQRYREVDSFRKHHQAKIDPLNEKIAGLNSIVSEIQSALQQNEARVREQRKIEQAEILEAKKEKYALEVGILNGYKVPHELTEAIQILHKYCRGRSLEQSVQTIIDLPDRYRRLAKLRQELEDANATDGLYDLPELSKELVDMAERAESRVTSILGHSPRSPKSTREGQANRQQRLE